MKSRKGREFNIHLSENDRKVIDELMKHNVNVSGVFKDFIKRYLEKIKKINDYTDI